MSPFAYMGMENPRQIGPKFQVRTTEGRERGSGAQCAQLVFSLLPWQEYDSCACLTRIPAAQTIWGHIFVFRRAFRTSLAEFWSVTISRASWFRCGSTCALIIGAMDLH